MIVVKSRGIALKKRFMLVYFGRFRLVTKGLQRQYGGLLGLGVLLD